MNNELLREMFQLRRGYFVALVLLALANAALYAAGTLWLEPHLARAQQAYVAGMDPKAEKSLAQRATAYRNGVRDLAVFDEHVIPKKDFAKFLGELFESARNNSLTVKGVSYRPAPVKDQPMVSYALSFTVSGRYPAVKSFIADLCRWPQLVTVDSVSLSNASKTQEEVELHLQLTVFLRTEGA